MAAKQGKTEAKKDGVTILDPDYSLKKLIGEDVDIKQIFNAENVSKAQGVIATHKDNFLEWVRNDLSTLEENYRTAVANVGNCGASIEKLSRAAFVIKSQAGTFGYSLATLVAKSLDDFCSRDFRPTQEHLTVIRKHIDALQAIFTKNIAGDGGALGSELTGTLYRLVEKYRTPK